jgi:hypothetical protein
MLFHGSSVFTLCSAQDGSKLIEMVRDQKKGNKMQKKTIKAAVWAILRKKTIYSSVEIACSHRYPHCSELDRSKRPRKKNCTK